MKETTVLLWLFILLKCVFTQDPVVNLPQGRIVGIKVYTRNSVAVEIYFGVPYALPPLGKYRFSPPERHSGWKRTLFTHRQSPQCIDSDVSENGNDHSSEDCLYLNIWTPRNPEGKLIPVVVILYSETWSRRGVNLLCEDLAADGIVVVTVSYRLNLLSFFTLRSSKARGNLALLDQYLALLWVRENIAAFGGEPSSVTILGHSAGADSVLHHVASTRSIGLFQRAIIMSPTNVWKTVDETININSSDVERMSREAANTLGCRSASEDELLHCMRTRPSALEIAAVMQSNANWSLYMQPYPDDFLPESQQYLSVPLWKALSDQAILQLDILLGSVDLEYVNSKDPSIQQLMDRDSKYINEFAINEEIPHLLQRFSTENSKAIPTLTQAVRWRYMSIWKNTESQDVLEAFARMESSAKWGAGVALLAARLARKVARMYVYRYSQPGINIFGQRSNFSGAEHGADLISLLGDAMILQITRRPPTLDERRFSLIFGKYIVNFVKFGSPGAENWKQYKRGDAHIFDIREDPVVNMKRDDAERDAAFWLQYLPELSNEISSAAHTEELTSTRDESRYRGGVYAMSGFTAVLLLFLCGCGILLRKNHLRRRFSITGDTSSRN